MGTKHTPGPWNAEGVMSEADHDIVLSYEVPGAGCPIVVATVASDVDDDGYPIALSQANANAKLIAASPDLAEACVAAIAATGGSHLWNGWTRQFLILAENALRKAGIDPAGIEPRESVGPEDGADDGYVAWCRYTGKTIVTCDSDAEGAFRVYRAYH
jgi:hypothetical protein